MSRKACRASSLASEPPADDPPVELLLDDDGETFRVASEQGLEGRLPTAGGQHLPEDHVLDLLGRHAGNDALIEVRAARPPAGFAEAPTEAVAAAPAPEKAQHRRSRTRA